MQEQTRTPLHFISLNLIIRLRWVSLIGQISTVYLLHCVGFIMPIQPMTFILGASLILTAVLHLWKKRSPLLNERTFPYLLLYDFFHLALLLFFTGGLLNPFVVFLLGPVFLMASFHNMKLLCTTLMSSSLVVAFLYISPYPLPWFDSGLVFDPLLRFAAAISLWGSILFYGTYLFYIHHRKFKLLQQLECAQDNLSEQKKITELGLMAAACAHELGTPLGTILLAAKEMESQTIGALRDEVVLITSQAKRCQVILKSLGSLYKTSSYFQVDLVQFVTSIFHTYPHTCIFHSENNLQHPYLIEGSSELSLAFGNIFQNVIRHAKTAVTVSFEEDEQGIRISVHDDGEGFDEGLLGYLGNILPEDTVDNKNTHTLGLGLFITKRLFEQKNVLLTFGNDHGAVYHIYLPYSLFEKDNELNTQQHQRRSA